jgi:hypothetical protein
MHVPKNHIHHPGLKVIALDAGNSAVILDTEQDHAAAQVGHRDDFPGERLGADVNLVLGD